MWTFGFPVLKSDSHRCRYFVALERWRHLKVMSTKSRISEGLFQNVTNWWAEPPTCSSSCKKNASSPKLIKFLTLKARAEGLNVCRHVVTLKFSTKKWNLLHALGTRTHIYSVPVVRLVRVVSHVIWEIGKHSHGDDITVIWGSVSCRADCRGRESSGQRTTPFSPLRKHTKENQDSPTQLNALCAHRIICPDLWPEVFFSWLIFQLSIRLWY